MRLTILIFYDRVWTLTAGARRCALDNKKSPPQDPVAEGLRQDAAEILDSVSRQCISGELMPLTDQEKSGQGVVSERPTPHESD